MYPPKKMAWTPSLKYEKFVYYSSVPLALVKSCPLFLTFEIQQILTEGHGFLIRTAVRFELYFCFFSYFLNIE